MASAALTLGRARRRWRRGTGHRRPPSDVRADINVTPLVDVVLVLLIIFMVVAPMISQGMPVALPRTVHHDRQPDNGQDLLLSVTREGQVYLRANPVAVRDLGGLVAEERRRSPGKTLYLQGDSEGRYQTVREVLEALHAKANLSEVQLRTDEWKPQP